MVPFFLYQVRKISTVLLNSILLLSYYGWKFDKRLSCKVSWSCVWLDWEISMRPSGVLLKSTKHIKIKQKKKKKFPRNYLFWWLLLFWNGKTILGSMSHYEVGFGLTLVFHSASGCYCIFAFNLSKIRSLNLTFAVSSLLPLM